MHANQPIQSRIQRAQTKLTLDCLSIDGKQFFSLVAEKDEVNDIFAFSFN